MLGEFTPQESANPIDEESANPIDERGFFTIELAVKTFIDILLTYPN